MIGKISGIIDYVSDDHILVDVGGVGYVIYVTGSTLKQLPKANQKISLFTELVVREDLLQLIGFVTPIEREWYKLLTSVQGVGSKAALALLGQLPLRTISRAILLEDSDTIKAAQGIGPKIAQRLVLELKGKVPSMLTFKGKTKQTQFEQTDKDSTNNRLFVNDGDQFNDLDLDNVSEIELDAISGLVNLGYSQIDSSKVVAEILNQTSNVSNVEELIRRTLKMLAKKG